MHSSFMFTSSQEQGICLQALCLQGSLPKPIHVDWFRLMGSVGFFKNKNVHLYVCVCAHCDH